MFYLNISFLTFYITYYIKNCNIAIIITPGIPKIPATNAVTQFNIIVNPKLAPIRLTIHIIAPPITPFISNFIINFTGKDKIFKII